MTATYKTYSGTLQSCNILTDVNCTFSIISLITTICKVFQESLGAHVLRFEEMCISLKCGYCVYNHELMDGDSDGRTANIPYVGEATLILFVLWRKVYFPNHSLSTDIGNWTRTCFRFHGSGHMAFSFSLSPWPFPR